MQGLDTMVITTEFRSCVDSLAGRLAGASVRASSKWVDFASRIGLPVATGKPGPSAIVVGSPADILKHAAAETHEFGFVMPVAQIARPWQRSSPWRDDATLDLWKAGWSPLAIDRLLVANPAATIEFVIGIACRRPTAT